MSPLRRKRAVAAAWLASCTPVLAAPPARDRIDRALASVREARDIQWTLPRFEGLDAPVPVLPLPLLEILLCTLIGIALIIALVMALNLVAQRVRGERTTPRDPHAPAGVRLSQGPRQTAERLAAEGRFGEAIHALLLGTIEELRSQPVFDPAPSETGREMAGSDALAPEARRCLGALIRSSEGPHFGGRRASEADYLGCLRLHEELTVACGAGVGS